MSDVTEGPAVADDNEGVVLSVHMPFAYQLYTALLRSGMSVGPLMSPLAGERLLAGTEGLHQFVVKRDDRVDALAATIKERCGPYVQFAQMAMPYKGGVVCASTMRAGDVWVRHLVAYRAGHDDMGQRYDVLVRAAP